MFHVRSLAILLCAASCFVSVTAQSQDVNAITSQQLTQLERLQLFGEGEPADVRDIAWASDGTTLIVSKGGIYVHNLADTVQSQEIYSGISRALASHPTEDYFLFLGEDYYVYKYDFSDATSTKTPASHVPATILIFAPDGSFFATADGAGLVYLWDASTFNLIAEIDNGDDDAVISLYFNNDGSQLVSNNLYSAKLWDIPSVLITRNPGTLPASVELLHEGVYRFTPTGELLLTGASNNNDSRSVTSVVKDITQVESLATPNNALLFEVTTPFSSLAFVPNSDLIVVGNREGRVEFFDETGEFLESFDAHQDRVEEVVINPQGTLIATASEDGTVQVWGLR